MNNSNLETAYDNALQLAKSHYENFPVVSFLIPKYMRKHVAIVYKFARDADDLADEGNADKGERLANLDRYQDNLNDCLDGKFASEFWFALADTINSFELDPVNFYNLLLAFKQDVIKNRFATFDEIQFYCRHSANPVGRIILELYGLKDETLFDYSDSICTALQLANFYQDVAIDINKNRIYVPLDEMKEHRVTEEQYLNKKFDDDVRELIKLQVDRAHRLFDEGRDLVQHLPGLLKHEIKWTILGGMEILKLIRSNEYDVFSSRPELNKTDMLKLIIKSFII